MGDRRLEGKAPRVRFLDNEERREWERQYPRLLCDDDRGTWVEQGERT